MLAAFDLLVFRAEGGFQEDLRSERVFELFKLELESESELELELFELELLELELDLELDDSSLS